jgi:hypothetical protein
VADANAHQKPMKQQLPSPAVLVKNLPRITLIMQILGKSVKSA